MREPGKVVARVFNGGNMMFLAKPAAATAAFFLIAQPCWAAGPTVGLSSSESRVAAFVGFKLRLPLGQKEHAKPTARLQLTSAYYARESSGALAQSRRSPGIEFGAGKTGQPALYIQGRDSAEMQKRLNMDGTTTLLIAGGVLLVVVVLAAAASATPKPGPSEGDFD